MNADAFRRIALALDGAVEGAHMGHPDFRVQGRIFASLYQGSGRVKLTPAEQKRLIETAPGVFAPANGAWGVNGWTVVSLAQADLEMAGEALTLAWQGTVMPQKKDTRRSGSAASARRPRAPEIDDYIESCPPAARRVLSTIRATIRKALPDADERLSYRMPSFFQGGALMHYAAFKAHIGVFPPVRGDADLARALAPYRGEKGNLRFPLDQPVPYDLIQRVALARLAEQRAKAHGKAAAKKTAPAKTGTTKTRTAAKKR